MTTTLRQRFAKEDNFNDYLLKSVPFNKLLSETLEIEEPKASKGCREVCLYEFDGVFGQASEKPNLRADIVFGSQSGYVLIESQLGKSDANHLNRLGRYLNSTQFGGMLSSLSTGKPDCFHSLVWVAESFRQRDLDAIREQGLPVACVQATPNNRSVFFDLVQYLPRLLVGDSVASVAAQLEPMWA